MYKLIELQCTNCEHQFEEMVDANGPIATKCPLCEHVAVQVIGLSAYGKHGSWAQWRAMDNDRS